VPDPFPFDSFAFLQSLPHLGAPRIAGLPLLARPIRDTGFHDAMGPLPYSRELILQDPVAFRERLIAAECVAINATVCPGLRFDEDRWRAAGFDVVVLKDHFLRDPSLPPPGDGKDRRDIRRNIRNARQTWEVRIVEAAGLAPLMWEIHHFICDRRKVSTMLDHPPAHFAQLDRVPGLVVFGAFDDEGLGGFLIVGRWENELHYFSVASAERGYLTGAAFALYDFALNELGKDCRVYMGGEPRVGLAEGIARFKARFANAAAPVRMICAVLDPDRAAELARQHNTPGWFPPYRGPYDPQAFS
jgi:hypothetical protein